MELRKRVQQGHKRINRGRWLSLGLAVAGLIALAACSRLPGRLKAQTAANGDARITLTHAGPSGIVFELPPKGQPWKTLGLHNAGTSMIKGVALWGLGGASTFAAPVREKKGKSIYSPFSLLPGEQFACSSTGKPRQMGSMINGIFYWELPSDPAMAKGCLTRSRHVSIGEDGTIVFNAAKGEAFIEFRFNAPLPHTAARVAWRSPSLHDNPQVWVNVNGDVWARLPLPRPQADWFHPVDFSSLIAGRTTFWVRVAYAGPESSPEDETGGRAPVQGGKTLTLTQLRIEREVQGAGALPVWRPGKNEVRLSLSAPSSPKLDVSLMGVQ